MTIIGITDYISNKGLNLQSLQKNLTIPEFLAGVLPADIVEFGRCVANCLHITYKKHLHLGGIRLFQADEYDLIMESDWIFEQRPADAISPLIIDFFCSQNTHFFKFSGRIRARDVPPFIKIGLYLEELQIRDEKLEEIGILACKNLIRREFREFFQKLNKRELDQKELSEKIK